jgi:hypothetical protein
MRTSLFSVFWGKFAGLANWGRDFKKTPKKNGEREGIERNIQLTAGVRGAADRRMKLKIWLPAQR